MGILLKTALKPGTVVLEEQICTAVIVVAKNITLTPVRKHGAEMLQEHGTQRL